MKKSKSLRRQILTFVLSASLSLSLFGAPVCATPKEDVGTVTDAVITGLCAHHTEHTEECGYAEGKPCGHIHTDECYVEATECIHVHTEECYPNGESGLEEESFYENASDEDAKDQGIENEDANDLFSNGGSAGPENCTHVCDVESGCITIQLACQHEHDEDCGYEEARPCTYQCSICSGQLDGATDIEADDDETELGAPDIEVSDAEESNTGAADKGAEDGFLCPHHKEHTKECGYIEGENSVCNYECAICALQELIDALPEEEEINADNAEEAAGQITVIDDLKAGMTDEELSEVDFAKYFAIAAALEGIVAEPKPLAESGTVRTERLDVSSMTSSQENTAEGWKWDYDSKTLTLTDCHIKTQNSGYMIKFPTGAATTIILEGENILESEIMEYGPMISGAIGSDNNYIFKGDGSLQFLANGQPSGDFYAYGISGNSITIESGTIVSNVGLCIIQGNFTMEGGSLTITRPDDSLGYGIYADNLVDIKGGKIDITIGMAGIYVPGIRGGEDQVANISGGEITIKAGSGGIHVGGYSSSGLQEINITGGTLKCEVSNHAGLLAKNINISGQAAMEVKSENQPAIRSWNDLTVSGEADIQASSPGSFGLYVPGTIKVTDSATMTAVGAVDGTAASVDKGEGAVLNAMIRTDTAEERIWTVYGNAELHSDLVLGPEALTTDTGTKPVKMVLTEGATLTIPERKTLDVTQGVEAADVDKYLSGDKDAIIEEGEGDEKGRLLLPTEKFNVSVGVEPENSGTATGAGTYSKDDSVTVSAQAVEGYQFVKWTENGSEVSTESSYTFTIEADRELTAVFEAVTQEPPVTETYTISVKAEPQEGGTVIGGGIYSQGESVTVMAQPESGYKFMKWTENGAEISGAGESYTFPVAADRQLTAVFEEDEGGPGTGEEPGTPGTGEEPEGPGTGEEPEGPGTGEKPEESGTGGESGSSGTDKKPESTDKGENSNNPSNSSEDTPASVESKPNNTQGTKTGVSVQVTETVKVSENGSAIIGNNVVAAAITRAQQEAVQKGISQNEIVVVVPVETGKGQTNADVTINAQTLDTLMDKNVGRFEVTIGSIASAEFDSNVLKWLDDKSAGEDIILRIRKAGKKELARESRAAIGDRPANEISLVCVKGTEEIVISDLGDCSIRLSLPYEAAEKENGGSLYVVYTDENGKTIWLTDSVYDPNRKAVLVRANRLGTYGIAYKDLTSSFKDIENHWAKNDIAYVVSRGFMQGTDSKKFFPDEAMTWESLLAALGRTAGVLPANSVGEAEFYRAWAIEREILNGSSYALGAAVTRQEFAILLANYLKNESGAIPKVYEEVSFTDLNAVPEQVKTAVSFVQQAGIMNGKDGNCFDPAGKVTKAEAAAAFKKLIELRIDASVFQEWTRNESGHWMYYQSGRRLTGWQIIDGVPYFFNADGVMSEGENQEPQTGNRYVYNGTGQRPEAMKKE